MTELTNQSTADEKMEEAKTRYTKEDQKHKTLPNDDSQSNLTTAGTIWAHMTNDYTILSLLGEGSYG